MELLNALLIRTIITLQFGSVSQEIEAYSHREISEFYLW